MQGIVVTQLPGVLVSLPPKEHSEVTFDPSDSSPLQIVNSNIFFIVVLVLQVKS